MPLAFRRGSSCSQLRRCRQASPGNGALWEAAESRALRAAAGPGTARRLQQRRGSGGPCRASVHEGKVSRWSELHELGIINDELQSLGPVLALLPGDERRARARSSSGGSRRHRRRSASNATEPASPSPMSTATEKLEIVACGDRRPIYNESTNAAPSRAHLRLPVDSGRTGTIVQAATEIRLGGLDRCKPCLTAARRSLTPVDGVVLRQTILIAFRWCADRAVKVISNGTITKLRQENYQLNPGTLSRWPRQRRAGNNGAILMTPEQARLEPRYAFPSRSRF